MEDNIKKEKREYIIYTEHMEDEDYLKILLCEDVLFINNGWWFKEQGKPWQDDYITIHCNCNDIFAWACADSEDVTLCELKELYEFWKKDPNWGPAAWCIKKRKQPPQEPARKLIEAKGIWKVKDLINGN